MSVAITRPCDKWCDTMIFTGRHARTCTYMYNLDSGQSSSDDPARAEKIRYTVKQYNNKNKLIKSIANIRKLDGTITFDLVDGCDHFDYTMQLQNSKGGRNNIHTNPQTLRGYPPAPYDLNIDFDVSSTKVEFSFKCKYNENDCAYRNEVRKSYKVVLTRETCENGKITSKVVYNRSDVIGWDSLEDPDWSSWVTDSNPSNDSDWIHYTLYVAGVSLNHSESEMKSHCSATKHFYIAHPPVPTIKSFTKSSMGEGGIISAVFNLAYKNGVMSRPMKNIELEYIWSENYPKDEEELEWDTISNTTQEVVSRSGNIYTTFAFGDSDITKSRTSGKHIYVRTKGWYDDEKYSTYSKPFLIPDKYYYMSSYTNNEEANEKWVKIESLTATDKGDSLIATIAYSPSYTNNGKTVTTDACRIGYSTDADAWVSLNQPSTYDMPDSSWRTGTNSNTSKIKISGLEENTTYYVRAQRYLTTNDSIKSPWSIASEENTGVKTKKTLTLTSEKNVVSVGTSCAFSWFFSEDLNQSSWSLKSCTVKIDSKGVVEFSQDIATLSSGTNTATSTTVTFNKLDTTYVYLTCGFNDNEITVTSTPIAVQVVNPPTVQFKEEPSDTLTSFPYKFSVKTDTEKAEVNIKISTNGMQRRIPEGFEYQYQNDVVYSTTGISDTGANGVVEFTIDNSESSMFWNSGVYMIDVSATKDGITSTTALTKNFTVNLGDKLKLPKDSDVIITPQDDKSVTVQVKNISDKVTWELYRATVDNRNWLIANDLKNEEIVTDKFAPFATSGNCYYIILIRNENNQFVFKEYEYTMIHRGLRFDWLDRYVELPYNVQISDANDKQFEQQVYLDGSQRGAWGASVIRTSSLSTDTVYIKDEETQKKVRELAQYQGEVFVRTSLGQAYVANVEVSSIEKAYNDKVMPVSFDCTEIDLIDEFMATKLSTEELT